MARPDLYLELDEALLNEGMTAGWQTGLASLQGKLIFSDKVPESLRDYAELVWRITLLGEPLLELREPDCAYIRMEGSLELLAFTMLPIQMDVALHVDVQFSLSPALPPQIAPPNTSPSNTMPEGQQAIGVLTHTLREVVIDRLVLQDQATMTREFLNTLNSLLAKAIHSYLSLLPNLIPIPRIDVGVRLPGIPDNSPAKLNLIPTDVRVFPNRRLGVGICLFDVPTESQFPASPQTTAPLQLRMHKDSLNRVYDFWWANAKPTDPIPFEGTLPLNAGALLSKGSDLLTRLISLGFLNRTSTITNLRLDYSGTLQLLEKPELLFQEPDKVGLSNLKVHVKVQLALKCSVDEYLLFDTSGPIPDALTPWQDDIQLSHRQGPKTLFIHKDLDASFQELRASLAATPEGSLALHAETTDVVLDFGNEWFDAIPEAIANGLIRFISRSILSKLPPLVISPSILIRPGIALGMTPVVQPERFVISADSITLDTRLEVAELKGKTFVPGYVANKKTQRVHRISCEAIRDIRPEHREGYFVLHEALKDGYKACQGCLKGAMHK